MGYEPFSPAQEIVEFSLHGVATVKRPSKPLSRWCDPDDMLVESDVSK